MLHSRRRRQLGALVLAGALGVGLATTAVPRSAQADADFNIIAFSSLGIIAAGMLGDYMRGNDIWAEGPEEPFRIAAGLGGYNVNIDNENDKGNETYGLFRVEARLPYKLWRFTPIAGVEVSHQGSVYGYGGFAMDVFFGDNIIVTPSAAVGLYEAGNARDLGYPVEFRTGIEAAWQFDNGSRLGLAYHHISNAELGDRNPGIENLTVNYAIPFDMLFGD